MPRASFPIAVALTSAIWTVACTGNGAEENGSEHDVQASTAARKTAPHAAPDSLFTRGQELYYAGDYESAMASFERIEREAEATGDTASLARALTWQGLSTWRRGEYAAARRIGLQALELKRRAGLDGQLFRSYNALGLLAWDRSRLFEAAAYFDTAFAVAHEAADSANLAKVATNRGLVLRSLGEFETARESFERALPMGVAVGNDLIVGRALANLASLAVQLGDPHRAIELLERALPAARRAEDARGEAYVLGQLGEAYQEAGEPARAIVHLDSALARARRQGNRQEEAENLVLLAGVHRRAGAYRPALDALARAKATHRELGLEWELGLDLRAEAEVYLALGNPELAAQRAGEALGAHDRERTPFEALGDLLVLSAALGRLDRPEEARARLEEAGALAERLDAPSATASVALARAELADRGGRPAAVLRALEAAERKIDLAGQDEAWYAWTLRARAHRRLGESEAALAAGRRAVAAVEHVRSRHAAPSYRTSYLADRQTPYVELTDLLIELGEMRQALEVADAARGRALLEHLPEAGAAAPGREPMLAWMAERERLLLRIRTLVERLDEIGLTEADDPDPEIERRAAAYRRELERARSDYEVALVRARSADPVGATLLGASRPTAAEIQGALRPGEALLEYFVTPERSLLFVVTRGVVRAERLDAGAAALSSRVRAVRGLLGPGGGGPGNASAALEGLHELLIRPALASGDLDRVRRLFLVPHGPLTYLPFAALRDANDGRSLVESFALVHLPAAGALPALRSREPGGSGTSGEPAARSAPPGRRFAPGTALAPFPDELPATLREIAAFEERIGEARIFRGEAATERRLREGLSETGIVHAATHGILNAWNPMFSRVLLSDGGGGVASDDGRLEVHELLTARVRSPLVVLSGCETALGPAGATRFTAGEDYATLARAFLYAGAANVLATLWRVEDRSAAVLVERFLGRLAELPPAEALAAAQRDLLAHPDYASPFHWAGYRLNGTGDLWRPQGSETASVTPERGEARPAVARE